jgi:nucleoside-diphosphate-sugar epimerase
MKKNRILVTGSTGFIGSELIKSFKNSDLYFISKKKIKKKYFKHIGIQCDLKKKNSIKTVLEKVRPTIIYHLAWHGIPNFNKKNFKINKEISNNLIEAINSSYCKKIIISGSCAEYGSQKSPVEEYCNKGDKISLLGKQKNHIRKLFYKKLNKNIVCIWARIFYAYGLGQRSGSLLNSIMNCKKKIFELDQSNVFHDFIYIKDVISALIAIKKINKSLIINICNGVAHSNSKFARTLSKLLNIKTICKKKINDPKIILYGSNKLLKQVGWKSRFNLRNSFKDILSSLNKL